METLIRHELTEQDTFQHILYEQRPVIGRDGSAVEGLHQVWLTLNNERQLNSYTTNSIKEIILAVRRASTDRRAVALVFTGAGTRAFCTGGNTAEYATYYAGRPQEYLQYMRLFNDMITALLLCDKPVICRVNGMRIGGGQEAGMACDFSVSADHARFGQAGPIHGSAPDGGATDFLHLYVGFAKAAESLVLCEPWSAYKALRLGLLNEVVPSYRNADGTFLQNPFVITDRYVEPQGGIVFGEWVEGAEKKRAEDIVARCTLDLTQLDQSVNRLVTKLLYTFPDCTRRTLESLRKKKLEHWFQNSESSRSWLALNMNAEAAAGFAAFHYGDKTDREINFIQYRRRLAEGARLDGTLFEEVLPPAARERFLATRSKEESK